MCGGGGGVGWGVAYVRVCVVCERDGGGGGGQKELTFLRPVNHHSYIGKRERLID